MRILIKEKLSEHKSKTPEGYLICQDAILARTGEQDYLMSEIYEDFDGEDRLIKVKRKPEQVFSTEALASFEDKPITIEHPDENVGPDNYSEYAVGHTRNIRKGKFNGQDVMIGDLVITDAQTIDDIENGIRTELSCGYDCDITKGDNPEQINIRGNHIALCEEGRAGIAKIIDSKAIIDSFHMKDMAMSKSDAMELCLALGKVFIEHFDKLYKEPENDASKHWGIEMKDKFDKVSRIVLKHNNKPILSGNLRDWFFTAGANPENFMDKPTDDELTAYDKFVNELLSGKDFVEALNNAIGKELGINDINPRKGENRKDFLARFMKETEKEYPDRKQRFAIANSYWDRKNLKDGDEETIKCAWCGEDVPKSDCRKEKDLGYICNYCQEAIKSHGESLNFAEGSDIGDVKIEDNEKYIIYADDTMTDDNKALFYIGNGKAQYMYSKDAPEFSKEEAEALENKDGKYKWIKVKFTAPTVTDSANKYVIYKKNGSYYGTPIGNYNAKIQNARLINNFNNFDSVEAIVEYLIQYTDLNREDIVVMGSDPIVEKAKLSDTDYSKYFYEEGKKEIEKQIKRIKRENEDAIEKNPFKKDYNRQRRRLYEALKEELEGYEKSIDEATLTEDSNDGTPSMKIKEWYCETFPTDDLGNDIKDGVTFMDLFNTLDAREDVYKTLGVNDSTIRERCFKKLADIIGSDYEYIYDQWRKAK